MDMVQMLAMPQGQLIRYMILIWVRTVHAVVLSLINFQFKHTEGLNILSLFTTASASLALTCHSYVDCRTTYLCLATVL